MTRYLLIVVVQVAAARLEKRWRFYNVGRTRAVAETGNAGPAGHVW
jgi:hypothetical protein